MKSKTLILSILLSLFFVVNSVYAAFTISVDVSKSLTENQQTTITVTVTNPSGSGTESYIVTSLSSGTSWFSVVTDCSTLISLSAGFSSTSTCIIKPTSTGNDLSLTATSTSQASTTGSGSTSGISVASQTSSLSASISGDSSVSTSATFYIGITVSAPSANDVVNARATISESGQCTVDTSYVPATQSLGNITKGTSKSPTNWKLTSSSASGTCSITVNIVSDVGGTSSQSKSITVGSGSSGSSGSASTGGGGGGGAAASKVTVSVSQKSATITIPSILAKSESTAIVNAPEVLIDEVKIKVVNTVSNVQVKVSKFDGRPSSVVSDSPGVVNQYLDINAVNISAADVEKVTLKFNVKKSWLQDNNIDESTVAMYRYQNDQWNKLETSKLSKNVENITYQSLSPGLSVFAISGETKAGVALTTTTTTVTQTTIKKTNEVTLPTKYKNYLIPALIVVLAIIVLIVSFNLLRKKE